MCVCVRERKIESGCVHVDDLNENEWERLTRCRETECVCVCVCVWERERERERKIVLA